MKLKPLLAALFLLPILALAQPTYTVTQLPVTDQDDNEFVYTALNNNGYVGGFDGVNGFYFDPSLNLSLLGTPLSIQTNGCLVTCLNDSLIEGGYNAYLVNSGGKGQSATWLYSPILYGAAYNPDVFYLPFFALQDGTVNGEVNAINDAGQSVGWAEGYDGLGNGFQHAAGWYGGAITDLGTLPGGGASSALAINQSGVAVGYAFDSTGAQHAVSFGGGVAHELGFVSGGNFEATAINSNGVAVGYGTDDQGRVNALLYQGGTPQILNGPNLNGFKGGTGQAIGIADDGTILAISDQVKSQGSVWIVYQGTVYDISTTLGPNISFSPVAMNAKGQILVQQVSQAKTKGAYNAYFLLTPQGGSSLTVTVAQRVDGGTVPDGTTVKVLNNDGTALSTPTSGTTVSGVATFNNVPSPTGLNTSYEVVVCVPTGAKGLPAVQHNVSLGQTTVYFTAVQASVTQSLTGAPPVAFASCKLGTVSTTTATTGLTPLIWLPDGTYASTIGMNPGTPCVFNLTLGSSSYSRLTAQAGYAGLTAHLTRIYLTARNANGTTFIPKAGIWSITPGGLSTAVNGQVISSSWWLPNGTYTGTLSGAAENGSSTFNVGTATASGVRTVSVSSGP